MRIGLWLSVLCALALAWAGCPHPPPPPPPPPAPPPVQIPPGCERNLSGVYAYAERPDWQYDATDDGGTVVMALRRELALDGGTRPDGGTPTVEIVLSRTPGGFVGGVRHAAFPAPGTRCPVVFDTSVEACPDGGLRLSSVEEVALDESCHPAPVDGGPVRREHLLLQLPPPGGDAGSASP